jgi:hypothetical protein
MSHFKYIENFYLTKIKDIIKLVKFYEYKLKMRGDKMTDEKINECNEKIKNYKEEIETKIDSFEDDIYKMEILECGEGENLIETDPDIYFQKFKLKIKEFEKKNYNDFLINYYNS